MVQGVNSAQTSQASQQSLFANQSQNTSSAEAATASSESEQSGSSVQQEAKISVLKDSLDTQEQNMQKLLNSTQGVGENIDTFA